MAKVKITPFKKLCVKLLKEYGENTTIDNIMLNNYESYSNGDIWYSEVLNINSAHLFRIWNNTSKKPYIERVK